MQKKLDYAGLAKARDEAKQLQIYSRFIRPTPKYPCARMPRNSGRQERVSRKNSSALQGAAEREPFDQSGVWGASPQQAAGRFPVTEISLFVKFV